MSVRRGYALTVTFAAIDVTDRPTRKTGLSFSAGDAKVSKDGAAFANTTNVPAEIGSTGRYSLALTATEMACNWAHVMVAKTGMDDVDLLLGTSQHPSALVVADGSNAADSFKTDLTEATNDYWAGALLVFTSGTLAGQVKKVSAYNGTTKFVTLSSGFTAAPSASDRFIFSNY